jgi:[glutamine synthetase] adenylyltransferase / [glutamine synthetase]-adenylyl-L-tyrosine phosphorylase
MGASAGVTVSDIRAVLDRLAESEDCASALDQLDAASAPSPGWRTAARELCRGPDPRGALLRASRLPEAVFAPGPFPRPLCRLMHQGGYPARLLQLVPDSRTVLEGRSVATPLRHDALVAELEAAVEQLGPDEALGRIRTREYLRLARREVENAPLEEIVSDLSTLAAACIDAGLRHLGVADRVAVFGMGKLGGNELNFLSDIDLVFVHADDLDTLPEVGGLDRRPLLDLHERLRTLVRLLEGRGRFKPLFRVDLRLRPFGSRGPLSMSVNATESYYERHGRPWERQAWLRARVVAGRPEIGAQMLRRLLPFVYPRNVSPAIFGEIAELMQRARRDAGRQTVGGARAGPTGPHRTVGEHDAGGVDLKLDVGGIREVEFTVQALQLLHGGKNPGIRSTSTLRAMDSLLAAGLISDREHRDLIEAYRWLRKVEHRLQLVEGQQTHRLPLDAEARALVAARLADADLASAAALLQQLERTLTLHRERVAAVSRTMAGEPDATNSRARALDAVLDMGAPADVRHAALLELGVRDPEEVEALLQHLYSREHGAFSERGTAGDGARNLLVNCFDSADPDAAIARLVEFAAPRPAHYAVWRFFAEPEVHGHDVLRLTAELFGTSETLSRGLIGFPVSRGVLRDESIGILQASTAAALPDAASLSRDLDEHPGDARGLDRALLRFKHRELVAIALHDLGRRPDALEVGRALSDLADLLLRVIARDLAAELGHDTRVHGLRIGLFALGKYGMQAMDYGSDLDLLFVYDTQQEPAGRNLAPHAIRIAQRLLARLQSPEMGMRLYEVDMRLRPSGRQGLLVSSLDSFARYHGRALPIWEQLALLRLRAIASIEIEPSLAPPCPADFEIPTEPTTSAALPGTLGTAVEDIVRRSLIGADAQAHADPRRIGEAVRHLKRRIEAELARETRSHVHAKVGRGGALELELLVSALQLGTAREHPHVLVRGIVQAIEGLTQIGALTEDEARALSAAYRFQRLLLNRLRMTHPGGLEDPDRFSQNSPRLVALARRMGLPSRQALLDRVAQVREVVRGAFDRHLEP